MNSTMMNLCDKLMKHGYNSPDGSVYHLDEVERFS
jgi:hypothetical protein